MLVRLWRRIGVGVSLGRRRLRNSGAFAGRCCRVVGVGGAVVLSRCWRGRAGVGGEGLDNQLKGREEGGGGGGKMMRSTTSSVGDDGGPASTTSLDPPTPIAASAVDG
jgi:hypothetical protein